MKEKGLAGLCGPYAIVNALTSILQLPADEAARRALAHRIASALPVSLASLKRDGTDRGQLLAMLAAAQSISSSEHFGPWSWTECHPRHGQSGSGFWARLKGDLDLHTVAIIGFGDYHTRSAYYEPHWTCVEAVKGGWGRRGSTQVLLQSTSPRVLQSAMERAWRKRAPKRLIGDLEKD